MADDVSRVGRAEIGDDKIFERRWCVAQRIAWAALALFVLAGLAGVFGRGPVSQARARSDSGLAQVEYQRFGRFETPATLTVEIDPRAQADGEVTVLVSGALIKSLRIEQTAPRPAWVRALPGGELFAFHVAASGRSTSIRFAEEPYHAGHFASRLEIGNGGGRLLLDQVVYP